MRVGDEGSYLSARNHAVKVSKLLYTEAQEFIFRIKNELCRIDGTVAVVSEVPVESAVEDCSLSPPCRQETPREIIKMLIVTILSISIALLLHWNAQER